MTVQSGDPHEYEAIERRIADVEDQIEMLQQRAKRRVKLRVGEGKASSRAVAVVAEDEGLEELEDLAEELEGLRRIVALRLPVTMEFGKFEGLGVLDTELREEPGWEGGVCYIEWMARQVSVGLVLFGLFWGGVGGRGGERGSSFWSRAQLTCMFILTTKRTAGPLPQEKLLRQDQGLLHGAPLHLRAPGRDRRGTNWTFVDACMRSVD